MTHRSQDALESKSGGTAGKAPRNETVRAARVGLTTEGTVRVLSSAGFDSILGTIPG